jgi:spermidine synthase
MVPLHLLRHGTTKHGSQVQDPRLRHRPTSFYHPSGPMGDVFRAFHSTPKAGNVGIVGLGAGAIAAYGEPGQNFTFYEIDPAVERIARDERYFTYLGDCRAELRVVLGDGRASLAAEPDARLGILVIDAFSSDSIPVHLLTREAVELYFRKLAPDGLLVLHISSRFFDLRPVVEAIAADLGLAGLCRNDSELTVPQLLEGKDESLYAVLARDRAVLAPLLARSKWEPIQGAARVPGDRRRLWTDEFSSVLGTLR